MKVNVRTQLLLSLWAALLAFAPFLTHAAETQVSIRLSDNLGHIGDAFGLKIRVKTPVDLDDIKFKIEKSDFEILGEQKTTQSAQTGFKLYEKNITLAFYKTGDFEVGPFTIELIKGGQVIESHKTNSVPVTIKTVLKEEDKDIKPLKGLMEVKGDPFYILQYVLLALGIIGLIVGVILYIRHQRKKAAAVPPPPLSPLEELIERLKELDSLRLLDKGKHKLHFIQLTQVVKHFLFRQYGFNAEDFTTYETLMELERYERDIPLRDNLRFMFDTADLVKFAKFVPDGPVINEVNGKLKDIMLTYRMRIPQPGSGQEEASADGVETAAGQPSPGPGEPGPRAPVDPLAAKYGPKKTVTPEPVHTPNQEDVK